MVLLAELLLLAGILAGAYRLATSDREGMPLVEPDRSPDERREDPLTADELAVLHLPYGVGYRKIDVDRLLDRVGRQLPRGGAWPPSSGPPAAPPGSSPGASPAAGPVEPGESERG